MITDSANNIASTQSSDEIDGKETSLQEQLSGDDRKESKDGADGCETPEVSSSVLLDNINTTSDLPSSLADSGHFEDMASSSVSLHVHIPALRSESHFYISFILFMYELYNHKWGNMIIITCCKIAIETSGSLWRCTHVVDGRE
jgi:hypothetical protein